MNILLIKKLKIEKILKTNIANILLHEVNDKRIKLITNILDVKINNDYSLAIIYIVFINIDRHNSNLINNLLKILQNSSGYIRFKLKTKIKLYKIPKLFFKYDNFYHIQDKLFTKLEKLK